MDGTSSTYFSAIGSTTRSLWAGLKLTLSHFVKARHTRKPVIISDKNYFQFTEGINTIQYPNEMQPVPDTGRYRLHNEIDDCIVCDKCAKVCPVDCITIEPIKATEEIGKTSDGTSKRIYAAKFDIDMGKCCFCGLCTTVCPTECLTMTNEYDFSVVDITQMNFQFSNLSPQQADEKRKLYEQFVAEKEAAKAAPKAPVAPVTETDTQKPAFKPNFKPVVKPT